MRIIEGKLKGKKDVRLEADSTKRPANVVDLMERLKRSLEQTSAGQSKTASKASQKKVGARNGRARRNPHAA
jgi:non-homologous end joining protein Ku